MATIDRRGATVSASDPPIGTNPSPDLAIKAPVRVATTGSNIALSGLQTVDGVALAAGDRVLAKDQADARTNGLYNASTGPWTRTIDAGNNSQLTTGTQLVVTNGTLNAGRTYELTTANPIILGTSGMTFALVALATGVFVGDSGTGGAPGLVPSPPAGSAVAKKFLSAAGDFEEVPTGSIRMYPVSGQGSGTWQVFDPFGNAISTAGTTTQGLQEAITAATTNNWPLVVMGHGTITCATAITIAPTFLGNIFISNEVILSFGALGSAALITINSQENSIIRLMCSVNQHSGDTGACIKIAPTTVDSVGNVVVAASTIEIFAIAPTSGGTGIQLDPTSGGFIGNEISIWDINGGATGIQILNPGTAFIAFEQNKFFLGYIHGQTTRVVQFGTGNTNQGNMRYNIWYPSRIDPGPGATVAFDTWASNDTFIGLAIVNETANAATGLKLESGANNNSFVGGHVAATTALSDGGTGNVYLNIDGVAANSLSIGNKQIVGARITGYTAMTGTPDKSSAFATSTVTLAQLAGRVMQLQADLTTHGLIGL